MITRILFFLCFFVSFLQATPLLEDQTVVYGQLENGLHFYIKQVDEEEGKAHVQLLVKCGSVCESEEERGFAHFVEHLVFRGTEQLSDGEVERYLDSIGAEMGPDANAYTSFNVTGYMFDIPLHQEKSLEKALKILSEFAGKATFLPEIVEKEKGVVLDEIRMRSSHFAYQLFEKKINAVFKNSPYENRLPAGLPEVIEKCTAQQLKQFYKKWYHPDRMAVIVAGSVRPDKVFSLIHAFFGDFPASTEKRQEPDLLVSFSPGSKALIYLDEKIPFSMITLEHFSPTFLRRGEEDDFECAWKKSLFYYLLERRLEQLQLTHPAVFLSVSQDESDFLDVYEMNQLGVVVFSEREREAFTLLRKELDLIFLKGFTEKEVKEVKLMWKEALEQILGEMEEAEEVVSECADHFLKNEPLFDPVGKVKEALHFLDHFEAEDIDKALFHREFKENCYITFATSSPSAAASFTEQELASLFSFDKEPQEMERATQKQLSALQEGNYLSSILKDSPSLLPSCALRKERAEGIEKWMFPNGMELILRPSSLEPGVIELRAVAKGGTASFSEADYPSAVLSIPYAAQKGFGKLPYRELHNLLQAHLIHFRFSTRLNYRLLFLESPKKNLFELFELFYAFFRERREDREAWKTVFLIHQEIQRAEEKDPDRQLGKQIRALNTQNHFLFQPLDLKQAEEEKAQAAFEKLFGTPQDFTLVLVGDFTFDEIQPLAEKFIASLPEQEKNCLPLPEIRPLFPPKSVEETVYTSGISKSEVVLSIPFDYDNSLKTAGHEIVLKGAMHLLEEKLGAFLRAEKGYTYGVQLSYKSPFFPDHRHTSLSLIFTTDTRHLESLKSVVLEELERLKKAPPSEERVDHLKALFYNRHEEQKKKNDFLFQEIIGNIVKGKPFFWHRDIEQELLFLTPDSIQRTTEVLLESPVHTWVVLRPKR